MRRIAALVEAARPKALRERVVHHGVWCDVPGEVPPALEAGLGVGEPRVVQVIAEIGAGRGGNMAFRWRPPPLETNRNEPRRCPPSSCRSGNGACPPSASTPWE